MNPLTLGERIKKVRKEKDLTQQEFGRRIGIKPNSISLIESGSRNASEQVILAICREFDADETWLRTGEGEMLIPKSKTDEIAAFVGDILRDESDFRQKFISVLARMTADEWKILEKKILEIADEIKKADP